MMKVVTRFAPSPTGVLHVGSARTALFNWLFARHHEGQFLLRIEDTDAARSTPQATESILSDLLWLGLHWDGDAVMQSQRSARHAQVAHTLVDQGHAYRCYCTPPKRDAQGTIQPAIDGTEPAYTTSYDRRCRERTDAPLDQPHVIRLKAPLSGTITLHDGVLGPVHVACEQLDDMVLLRSDGSPTYMLAVVVDDHDMNVTHIIRGDDHLTNAFRQLNLYHALGWQAPVMYHIPLIHSAQGVKLSKRLDAAGLTYYREQGFLPQALTNALVRLGWSHGDEEKISMAQAIQWFDGSHLSKSPARFDGDKVRSLNSYYLRQMAQTPEGVHCLWHHLLDASVAGEALVVDPQTEASVLGLIPALTQRCSTLAELKEQTRSYTTIALNPAVCVPAEDGPWVTRCIEIVEATKDPWDPHAVIDQLRTWCAQQEVPFSVIAKVLRLSLTGRPVAPGLHEIMQALGRDRTLIRLRAVSVGTVSDDTPSTSSSSSS